jgi:CHASE3 domain sensor protein
MRMMSKHHDPESTEPEIGSASPESIQGSGTIQSVSSQPIWAISIAAVSTVVLLLLVTVQTYVTNSEMTKLHQEMHRITDLRANIQYYDEVLTMSARMAAFSGDLSWEARYRRVEKNLEQNLAEALQIAPDESRAHNIKSIDEANTWLVNAENQAFELARAGRLGEASSVVMSDEYKRF